MVDNENCFHLKNRYTKASFLYILHWDYLRQLPFLPLAAFFAGYDDARLSLTLTVTVSSSTGYVAFAPVISVSVSVSAVKPSFVHITRSNAVCSVSSITGTTFSLLFPAKRKTTVCQLWSNAPNVPSCAFDSPCGA